ncbi:eIF5-mimic protein 1 isoform X1 [Pseudophryne corroboree]|uniref:eIF5-mimic protein 1 isoform X1 n=2 Tax=Pseudophryne corroboree TaxID=495146 RepID=UPI0030818DAD
MAFSAPPPPMGSSPLPTTASAPPPTTIPSAPLLLIRHFMNKHQKPVLTGQRFKTRKRDEKEKFEPTVFRDTIIQGLNEAGNDLEAVAKFLDTTGSRLDYRRYADTLFDILIAGSMLAPGGTRIDDGDKTKVTSNCVFGADEDYETMRNYAQVFSKLIRRYKYLEKAFEEEIKKLLLFLKAFSEAEQTKLAVLTGILLAGGTLPASILTSLFTENIVKEGISASFSVKLFKAWMAEKDDTAVTSSLRKANLDKRLLELFPANRQTVEHFAKYFTDAGLKELSDFLRVQQSLGTRKELQKELQERLSQECPIKEVVLYLKEEMKRNELAEPAVIGLLWTCVMNAVEWNKKEELVAEQALKHLKQYAPVLAVFSTQGQSELVLLQKVQEYCYDNIHFMKAFQKIVVLFYKADVLGEEAILKWYKEAHIAKGKSVFLDQMKKFVEWLQNAEEESESEGEEN